MKTLGFEILWNGKTWTQQAVLNPATGEVTTGKAQEWVGGLALPGLTNAHSHAFQYAMAGRAERAGPGEDSFWTWRETMYELALGLEVQDVRTIAHALYESMRAQGWTRVVEFHYLHHKPTGETHNREHEMALALCESAQAAGLGLTLVPVFYSKGGFDEPPQDRQRRFLFKEVDAYWSYLEKLEADLPHGAILGEGLHSLRAATREQILDLWNRPSSRVRHTHISEQLGEVEACQQAWGLRPIEWLAKEAGLTNRDFLVHATHTTEEELKALEQATVVLCPTTEANLGDGIFDLVNYQGAWCVGTDSHVSLSALDELRWADYTQRLTSNRRTPLAAPQAHSGETQWSKAWSAGLASAGHAGGDYSVWDLEMPLLQGLKQGALIDALVFSGSSEWLVGTVINGHYEKRPGSKTQAQSQFGNLLN